MIQIVEDLNFKDLVNTNTNEGTLNEIFSYKESFSPLLFSALNKRYNFEKVSRVYEPFLGTGSTFLNEEIKECFGVDTNPLSIMVSKAKLEDISKENITQFINDFDFCNLVVKEHSFPQWSAFSNYVSKDKFNYLMTLFDEILPILDSNTFNFVKMVLVSNLDLIFDYKRDGNGIKYRKSKIAIDELPSFVKQLITRATQLKLEYQEKIGRRKYTFKTMSSTQYDENMKDIDLIITSPPYCNMFDYFEVYKVELWTAGIVKSTDEMRALKKSALRNNFNAKINFDKFDLPLLSTTIENLKTKHCDDKKIRMINNYFYDMNQVICNCNKYLKKDACFCIVVGNSFYCGVPIATDEIISHIGLNNGFELVEIIKTRTLSTSSQQMKIIEDKDRKYLRESIVVLKKKGDNNENN